MSAPASIAATAVTPRASRRWKTSYSATRSPIRQRDRRVVVRLLYGRSWHKCEVPTGSGDVCVEGRPDISPTVLNDANDPKRTFNSLLARVAGQKRQKGSSQRIDIQLASVHREASDLNAPCMAASRCPVLLDRRDGLDLQQEVWTGQLRREDCSTLRRRRAEIARQQIGVFLEVGRRRNEVNSKHDVVDCRAAGLKTLVDVLANLLDLRAHIAFSDDIAGLVARDLGANQQPAPPVAQGY